MTQVNSRSRPEPQATRSVILPDAAGGVSVRARSASEGGWRPAGWRAPLPGVGGEQEHGDVGAGEVRTWTVEEANAALEWVAEVVARAQAHWQDYRAQATRRAKLVRQNGHGLMPADPGPIQSCIDELAVEGVVLRDIARGLIDFPAQAPSGRIYWLCWLAGEEAVTWWHWPEDGFAGRTPITEPPE
jgi:hypothetical protein